MIVALPTARGWLLTLLAVGAVAVALVNVGLASAMAATAFCSIWLASLLMAQFSLWGIRVERLPNTAGYSGSELVLPLRVENRMTEERWAFRTVIQSPRRGERQLWGMGTARCGALVGRLDKLMSARFNRDLTDRFACSRKAGALVLARSAAWTAVRRRQVPG